jgi:hypothetical protein
MKTLDLGPGEQVLGEQALGEQVLRVAANWRGGEEHGPRHISMLESA